MDFGRGINFRPLNQPVGSSDTLIICAYLPPPDAISRVFFAGARARLGRSGGRRGSAHARPRRRNLRRVSPQSTGLSSPVSVLTQRLATGMIFHIVSCSGPCSPTFGPPGASAVLPATSSQGPAWATGDVTSVFFGEAQGLRKLSGRARLRVVITSKHMAEAGSGLLRRVQGGEEGRSRPVSRLAVTRSWMEDGHSKGARRPELSDFERLAECSERKCKGR